MFPRCSPPCYLVKLVLLCINSPCVSLVFGQLLNVIMPLSARVLVLCFPVVAVLCSLSLFIKPPALRSTTSASAYYSIHHVLYYIPTNKLQNV